MRRIYYIYDITHCQFRSREESRPSIDPEKLRYRDVSYACWTDLEKAKEAIEGVLQAKAAHLEVMLTHTKEEFNAVGEVFLCDGCGEITMAEDLEEWSTTSRMERFLCPRCVATAEEENHERW